MRLGIHLPQFREPVPGDVLSRAARDAEAAGADDLWVSDHVILPPGSTSPPSAFHDPLTVLTWAAATTTRVGLGTSVLVVPYRHPVLLAKSLASLDALSGGRVVAGLASGWMAAEFDALGVPFAGRGPRTDEAIACCRALWRGDTAFHGRHVRFEGMGIEPLPARPGGPPLWIGGNSDAGIRRAAHVGDAWHTTVSDAEALRERLGALDAALAAEGRTREGFTVSVRVRADTERMARVAPRLRDLGVDHVLVDPPEFHAGSFGDLVARLRELADA